MQNREPNSNLLYLVAVFAIEPGWETRELFGSLGRVAPDGDLEWHVEVIQVRRREFEYSSGAALAVTYLRIEERESPNFVYEEDVRKAFELLETLIAPKELAAERPLTLRVLNAVTYRGNGVGLGGSVYSNMVWNAGSGPLGSGAIDSALLDEHPELRLAVRFYTRGIGAADERFLPDSVINYTRSLECLVGSTSDLDLLRNECNRLGLDGDSVVKLLSETRGKYAVAHSLDRVVGRTRKLKEVPTPEIERSARELAQQAIRAYIDKLPPLDHERELRKGVRYTGLPPVSTSLPLPREVLWEKMGPWDQAAPGMAPDTWVPLATAARQYGMSYSRLRHLVRRHLVRGYKNGARWQVSCISIELYQALASETAMHYRGSIYSRIRDAAANSGITISEMRELVRKKGLRGHLRSRFLRHVVDVNSLRYLVWRRRRAPSPETLSDHVALPSRAAHELAREGRHQRVDDARLDQEVGAVIVPVAV